MSTRAVIARKTAGGPGNVTGFEGVYHHWDGYPSGLGATLYKLWRGHFKRKTPKMLAYLIDQHPAGWSTICGRNFKQAPGKDGEGPECYCHGSRHEEGNTITHLNASGCGCEYAYVFEGGQHDGCPVILLRPAGKIRRIKDGWRFRLRGREGDLESHRHSETRPARTGLARDRKESMI